MLALHPERIVAGTQMAIEKQRKSYAHNNICGNKNIYHIS